MSNTSFFIEQSGGYLTTAGRIVRVKKFFDEHPNGVLKTGIWTDDSWNKEKFYAWFRKCLFLKTGGAKYTEDEILMIRDGRKINDYVGKRIRHTGSRNFLSTPALKAMYPEIDNQTDYD